MPPRRRSLTGLWSRLLFQAKRRQGVHDPHRLPAHGDDTAQERERVGEVAHRLDGVAVGVVDDAGLLVDRDAPALHDVLDGGLAVDDIQGRDAEALCADGGVRGAVRALARRDLHFEPCLTRDRLPPAAALVEACPEVRLVLDHIGKPAIRDGALDPWRGEVDRLAAPSDVV